MDVVNKSINRQINYLILSYIGWGIFWGSWGVLLPEIKEITGASEVELGNALIAVAVGALPTMLGTGAIVKGFNKYILCLSLLLFAIAIFAVSFVKTPVTLAIALFFVGATSGALDVIMNSGVAALEDITNKKYFNMAHAAFPIAVIITSPVVGFAREMGIHSKTILYTIAIIIFLISLSTFKLKISYTSNTKEEMNNSKIKGPKLYFTKMILIFGIIGLLIHLMENAVEQWSTLYLENYLLSSPSIASLGLTSYMGMLFVGRLLARKINLYWSEGKMLIIFSIISILGFLVVTVSTSNWLAIAGFSITGLGISPVMPIIFSLTGRKVNSSKKVMAISSVTTVAYLGYLLSPPLIGRIVKIFDLKTAWFFLDIIAFITAIIIVLVVNNLSSEVPD